VKTNLYGVSKNPAFLAGFFLLLTSLVSGCQTPKQPEQVTAAFWQAMVNHDLNRAKHFIRQADSDTLTPLDQDLSGAQISTGKIIIEKPHARVETILQYKGKKKIVTTYLVFEDHTWKVDASRTLRSFSGDVFENLLKNLDILGEQLNQQLEQEIIPRFQHEAESLGQQLQKQLEQFNQNLKKFLQPKPTEPKPLPPDQRQI